MREDRNPEDLALLKVTMTLMTFKDASWILARRRVYLVLRVDNTNL